MPEIPESCEFDVEADHIVLRTRKNGDLIEIQHINLSQDNAAALAYLVNHPNHLKIEIRVVE